MNKYQRIKSAFVACSFVAFVDLSNRHSASKLTESVFRDINITLGHGAAIDAHGSLLQFSTDNHSALATLSGAALTSVVCSLDHVFCLSAHNQIFSLEKSPSAPITFSLFSRPLKSIPFHDSLRWGESVSQISTTLHTFYLLTSHGRIFTLSENDHSLHLINHSENIKFTQIASGFNHVLFLGCGRVFGLGSNSHGQLGLNYLQQSVDTLTEITSIWNPIKSISKPLDTNCSSIAASGDVSFFVVDDPNSSKVLACGSGQSGQLGNGTFNHRSFHPSTVQNVSDLKQYDQKLQKIVPIRISSILASPTHAAAIFNCSTGDSGDSIIGDDVYVWGDNKNGQLNRLDQKSIKSAVPVRMKALDAQEDDYNQRLQLYRQNTIINGKSYNVKQTLALGPGISIIYQKLIPNSSLFG